MKFKAWQSGKKKKEENIEARHAFEVQTNQNIVEFSQISYGIKSVFRYAHTYTHMLAHTHTLILAHTITVICQFSKLPFNRKPEAIAYNSKREGITPMDKRATR